MSGRILIPPLSLLGQGAMEARTLSVFVDESGNFRFPDSESRFYIVHHNILRYIKAKEV